MPRPLVLIAAVLACLLTIGSGSAAATRLYAPLYYSEPQAVAGYDAPGDGSLVPLAGSPFTVVSGPPFAVAGIGGMAFAPDGDRAAISFYFEGGVLGTTVGAGGALASAQEPIAVPSGGGIAVTPDGRFAYVPGSSGIRGYAFAPSGVLSPLSGSPYGSGGLYDVAITPDGRFLFATEVGSQVAAFSIGADGALTPLGTTPVGGATYLSTSPDGRFLFVGVTSAGPSDGVVSFSIGADGSLTQNGPPALTGDVSMHYFSVAADGRFVYMPDGNVDGVVTAAVAPDGSLSVIGTSPVENVGAVVASPDGRFLYWSTPQNGGFIGAMSIGADGIPTLLPEDTIPWDSGEWERPVIQPRPTPVASFTASPAPPGAASAFDAGASQRAARFDWDFGDGTTLADGGPTPRHAYAGAGTYTVKLTVTDAQGCSATQLYLGQSTTCPGGSAAVATRSVEVASPVSPSPLPVTSATRPVISGLSVTNKRFAIAPKKKRKRASAAASRHVKHGTAFRYTLSEAARVQFKIERRTVGRMVGGKCRPKTRANEKRRRCVFLRKASPPVIVSGVEGANLTPYSGRRKGGKRLPPGSYRARAVATDAAGARSDPAYVGFTVIPG